VLLRPIALKLLAPTGLVSLALVAACIFSAVYLNLQSVHLSKELAENVASTRAAQRLETTTNELIRLLHERNGSRAEPEWSSHMEELIGNAEEYLTEARELANLEQEEELVPRIFRGFNEFRVAWKAANNGQDLRPHLSEVLAQNLESKVLEPCRALRNFNLSEIQKSNDYNKRIVQQLTWGLLAVGFGAPLSGLLLGYAMARSLHHSIYQLSVGIRDAAGRLNRQLGSVTVNEEGTLSDVHKQMQGVIAEIERVVEQLQQREREVLRAEQLAAVGQVAAGVAHEMRNPLTAIKMLVQTGLEGERAPGLPPEDLAIMENEIRRMEQCIQLFLDFARPPNSERRQTDLVAVLRRALALVEGRARRQKVTLLPDLPSTPVGLFIDPEQIHQVVVNLLLNALDALPRGGTVTLSLAEHAGSLPEGSSGRGVDGFARTAKRWVEVRVHDSGPGILPRIRDRLFEPFVSSKETGVGLGLSISKRLIEAHGGTIRGEDVPGGGAVFVFTVPS
jgi:signal transduction histidine kinase